MTTAIISLGDTRAARQAASSVGPQSGSGGALGHYNPELKQRICPNRQLRVWLTAVSKAAPAGRGRIAFRRLGSAPDPSENVALCSSE